MPHGQVKSLGMAGSYVLGMALAMQPAAGAEQFELEPAVHAEVEKPGHQEAQHEARHKPGHHSEHRFTLALLGSAHGTAQSGAFGGGMLFGWAAVPHRFDLEVAFRAVATEGGVGFSQELLAKFPYQISRKIHPFVEFGLNFAEFRLAAEERGASIRHSWGIGCTLESGIDYWITSRVGVFSDLDYNAFYHLLTVDNVTRGRLVHEFGGSVGVLFGL